MNSSSGTHLVLGVAALFSAACESPASTEKTTTTSTATASDKPTVGKTSVSKSAAKKSVAGQSSASMPMAEPAAKTVHCLGIHECKGKSACHVKDGHACAGQNDCKGKGWIVVPELECESKGGKVVES